MCLSGPCRSSCEVRKVRFHDGRKGELPVERGNSPLKGACPTGAVSGAVWSAGVTHRRQNRLVCFRIDYILARCLLPDSSVSPGGPPNRVEAAANRLWAEWMNVRLPCMEGTENYLKGVFCFHRCIKIALYSTWTLRFLIFLRTFGRPRFRQHYFFCFYGTTTPTAVCGVGFEGELSCGL